MASMKGIWLLFVVALLLPIAVACGDDDDTADPTATTTSGDPTATQAPETAYPVTVTDLLGRDVDIEAKPEKIVALSPSAVEFVYAMGGTVVGRTSSVTYPEEALSATEVSRSLREESRLD